MKNKLARPGYDATQALLEEVEDSDPALAQSIRKPRRLHAKSRAKQIKEEKQRVALWERAVYRPEPFEVPRALRAKMEDVLARWDEEEYVRLIVRVDLDADGDPEYVVLMVNPSEGHFNTGAAFQRKDGQWRIARSLRLRRGLWRALEGKHPSSMEDFENTDLLTDPVETIAPLPALKGLKIGEVVIDVRG